MAVLYFICAALVVLVLVMLAAAGYSLGHSRKVFATAGVCLVLSVVMFLAASQFGEAVRLAEFDRNRALADGIITHVEAYKRQHSHYPEALSAIGKPMQTTLCFGGDETELRYARREPDEFSLTYFWTSTQYVYRSQEAKWSEIIRGD